VLDLRHGSPCALFAAERCLRLDAHHSEALPPGPPVRAGWGG
jgi:hypothetical protein